MKWKAREEGLMWHSLATVKKADVYHPIVVPRMVPREGIRTQ